MEGVDVTKAFNQRKEPSRNLFIRPALEFKLPPEVLFQLILHLYGQLKSGDAWYFNITDTLTS